jgi:hypothetical protein
MIKRRHRHELPPGPVGGAAAECADPALLSAMRAPMYGRAVASLRQMQRCEICCRHIALFTEK